MRSATILDIDPITRKWIRTRADEHAAEHGCYFDLKAANRPGKFFRQFLRHSKGEWAGKPFELLEWQQKDLIMPIFGWKNPDGTRRFRISYAEIAKKNGKALALDTKIPTPTGWTTIGAICAGDTVFDENGLQCKVTGVTEVQYERPCYEVVFSDGCRIVADAEHEWYTDAWVNGLKRTGLGAKSTREQKHIRTTRQILDTLRLSRPSTVGKVSWNHRVTVAEAIECNERALPIHPYVLGAWLGDGTSSNSTITCAYSDIELIGNITACGTTAVERKSTNQNTGLFTLGKRTNRTAQATALCLSAKLRAANLINNKHIPSGYLRASKGQRFELLQGLMDTDGYCSKSGQCEFTTISEQLRDGFLELARSLGLKPSLTEGRATIYGKDCGPKYRIHFFAFQGTPIFRLKRKQMRLKHAPLWRNRTRVRQIVGVNPVKSVPVKCIEVDSPSHLYLAGESMIQTHNSSIAAGVGLLMLSGDKEGGAEVYSAATDQQQASIVHGEAVNMVRSSPELAAELEINKTTKTISYHKTNSFYRALSAEAHSKEGLNAHCVIVDELHVWKGRALWDALKYAFAARRQGLLFIITTAGNDPLCVCREQHDYAAAILDGTIKDDIRFFSYIAAASDSDDWTSPETWKKANPSMGVTIKESDFAADVKEAQKSPTTQAAFKRYRLNIWTTAVNPWLKMEDWNECASKYGMEEVAAGVCYAGLDLSRNDDLSSLVLVFPEDDGFKLLPFFWLPESTIQNPDKPELYRVWAREGLIEVTSGDVCDYGFIKKRIAEIAEMVQIREIAFDPWGPGEPMMQALKDEFSIEGVKFPQTIANFSSVTSEFERLIMGRKILHNGHPILTWHAGNVAIKEYNGNIRPVKPEGGANKKIDGIVAAIMGLARARMGTGSTVSYYESAGAEI